MTFLQWKAEMDRAWFFKAHRATALIEPVTNGFHVVTLIGDKGRVARLRLDSQHLGEFIQDVQNNRSPNDHGSLVVGWGLVATGGLGPGPIGPPGPVGEPPLAAANVNLHFQIGALAELANAAKLG